MVLILTIDGDEKALDAGMNAFARHHGWTEDSGVTQLEHSRQTLVRIMREAVKCWNVEEAKRQVAVVVADQVESALDALKTTLETSP